MKARALKSSNTLFVLEHYPDPPRVVARLGPAFSAVGWGHGPMMDYWVTPRLAARYSSNLISLCVLRALRGDISRVC